MNHHFPDNHRPFLMVPALGCLLIGLTLLTGCGDPAAPGASVGGRESWAQRRLAGVSPDQVFDVAVVVMRDRFPHVNVHPGRREIESEPSEYTQTGGTGRVRDAIGYKNRMRRKGTLIVSDMGQGSVVRLRVDRERLDTSDHRAMYQQEQRNDVPNETPIDRDAGLSPDQEQVWTDMGRDRQIEGEILEAIRVRVTAAGGNGKPE